MGSISYRYGSTGENYELAHCNWRPLDLEYFRVLAQSTDRHRTKRVVVLCGSEQQSETRPLSRGHARSKPTATGRVCMTARRLRDDDGSSGSTNLSGSRVKKCDRLSSVHGLYETAGSVWLRRTVGQVQPGRALGFRRRRHGNAPRRQHSSWTYRSVWRLTVALTVQRRQLFFSLQLVSLSPRKLSRGIT